MTEAQRKRAVEKTMAKLEGYLNKVLKGQRFNHSTDYKDCAFCVESDALSSKIVYGVFNANFKMFFYARRIKNRSKPKSYLCYSSGHDIY